MLASVVIPTLNHLESDLKACIQSIKATTDMNKIEVIISANGCTDGTEDYVKSLGAPFKLISSPEPLGYAGATNAGMALAKGEYIVLLNNDCAFLDSSWLDKLIKPFLDIGGEKVAVTGPMKNFWGIRPHIVFFCAMFRRSLLYQIGMLDDAFAPGAGEDTDWCMRALKAGLRIAQVSRDSETESLPISFPIWHKGSATVNEIPKWPEIVARNAKILEERYPKFVKASAPPPAVAQGPMFSGPYDASFRSKERYPAPVEAIQFAWEFGRLVDVYKDLGPDRVLEVGSYLGGSLYHWMNLAKPGTRIASVEAIPQTDLWNGWAKEKKVEFSIIQGDSHSNETVRRVKEALGCPIDFLFIDADHTYLAAKSDFMMYGPLVRKGGVIAFHDILKNNDRADFGVWQLWQEIKEAGYKTQEFYSSPSQGLMGIGVIYP